MTATLNHASNGAAQRRSLAGQLDRLDHILDGLDQALSGAITEAVKDAVSSAVAEAVRATLLEIVANPQVLSLLSSASIPTAVREESTSPTGAEPPPRPGRLRRVWQGTKAKCRAAVGAVAARAERIYQGVSRIYRQANAVWKLKRPLVIAIAVGAVVGMVVYASSPWLAGIVGGLSTTGAALGAQMALFVRRLFAACPGTLSG